MINAIQAFVSHESVNLFCLKYNMNLIKPSEKKIIIFFKRHLSVPCKDRVK